MSWLSKGIKGLGHIAEKAAPYAGLIPGVGTVAGGLIGGIGGLAAGDGLSGALKYGAEGAAGGLAGGGLRSAITGAIAGHGGMPTTSGEAPSQGVYDSLGSNPSGAPSDGSGVGGFLSGAVKSALGGGGQPGQAGGSSTNPWLLGLAGLQGANSAYLGQKSNALSDKALKGVEQNYASRAPLRAAGLRGLLNPTAPDTTQLSTIASRNPYAVPSPVIPPAQIPMNRMAS